MKIVFHQNFERTYKKLRIAEKGKCKERISMFTRDPLNPLLNNHALHGAYSGYRSINISGDLRAIYKLVRPDIAIFVIVDTHGNLYL